MLFEIASIEVGAREVCPLLQSYFEDDEEGPYVPCTPAAFDAEACEAAVNP